MQTVEWWQNAVIYQIVPWSFLDTDGDGRGNLNGIIDKLDYISALGVDAIWLTPIYESPMDDLGYDITDMLDIDPVIGDLDVFDKLLALTHARGLRMVVDQVWGHTSDRHFWFLESSESRDNPKSDWYIWADPKPDGSPPNNWLSAFNGDSAWAWEPKREQYFLFHFLRSQPKLNWENPDVVEAILSRAKFWLDRGVDGFRLDAPNFFLHDPELRDEPLRGEGCPHPDGIHPDNPMAKLMFENSFCRPEALDILKPVRELIDQYPSTVTLAEVTLCEDSIVLSSEYVKGSDRAHLAYNSALLVEEPISAQLMRRTLEKVQQHFTNGGNCWMVGNHDYGRLRSRWLGHDANGTPYPETFYHQAAAMLVAMPGALCLYQGDELGLSEARIPEDIPVSQIQDPFGKALYPAVVGRDGSRTPMPWQANAVSAGFSSREDTWLPVPQAHHGFAVDVQNQDPSSLLNTWRGLLHWRKDQPALMQGECHILETEEPFFAFIREAPQQRLLCIFNLSAETTHFDLPEDMLSCTTATGISSAAKRNDGMLRLRGYGYFFGNLQPSIPPAYSGSDRDREAASPNPSAGDRAKTEKAKTEITQATSQPNAQAASIAVT
ncbi:alpha glucosidase [Nodosilinea sp. E11]|uniref:alpha-glucosidase n=1 Tax=Nodosilinea sp. E11 TaxID=3037479 RepID=UPI00293461A1|nr:alpha glucosidase [Nodosilinea sp. E11]WOD40254.1 alpha glucosidase [Nodosilinea sp. E11]